MTARTLERTCTKCLRRRPARLFLDKRCRRCPTEEPRCEGQYPGGRCRRTATMMYLGQAWCPECLSKRKAAA
jgi:hypothetical protein